MDRFLRHSAPLILLGLGLFVWLEPWLPGRPWRTATFGADGVLRFALGCVCVYTAVLIVERAQMMTTFRQVLGELGQLRDTTGAARAADPQERAGGAARILLAALESPDPAVRERGRSHLARILGRDLGDDPAAWRAAVDVEEPHGGA